MKGQRRSKGEGQRERRQSDGDRRALTQKRGRSGMKEKLSARQK